MLSNFGPSQGRKGLENGAAWDHKWLENGSKPWFSKNDYSPVVVPKRMNIAHFEPLLSSSHPLSSVYLICHCQCSFPHQLGPNNQSWLGVRVRGRVRCRVRSRLRVGVGVRAKVGFKCSVGVLHRLGREGCYVGKGGEKKFFGRLWCHHMYGR